MNVLYGFLMVTVLVSALWWAFARGQFPRALALLSFVSLGLTAVTLVLEGLHWQVVPWQVLAIACAAAAALRWWRPGRSRGWRRAIGRVGLLAGVILGGVGLLFAGVPLLPRPAGQHLVGSTIFHWTDPKRAEVFTEDPQDQREVVVQAWYPTDTAGPPVPYFEAQGRLPAYVDPYPGWFYGDFDKVDTHASASPPVSTERPTWPVLLFLPGWGSPREDYSALCADLASRGYVVVALSHPYESAVSVLADGRVVGTAARASVFGANMADMTPIRAADSSFVLDQLSRLALVEPGSPLVGHLDIQHAGIVGHSMGGAAAAQVVAEDSRFLVGVNLDGILPATLSRGWHLSAPFLWLQSDGQQQASYLEGRDRLLAGVPGSEVLVVGGTSHTSFTDLSAYWSPFGRGLTGDDGSQALVPATTAELIAAFVSAPLTNADEVRQRLARIPGAKIQVNVSNAQGGGQPVAWIIQGSDSTSLSSLAAQLEQGFQGITGLRDVTNSAAAALPELDINVDRTRAAQAGVSAQAVGSAVRLAYSGVVATKVRQTDGQDLDVRLLLAPDVRGRLSNLGELPLQGTNGPVRLSQIATIANVTTPSQINRRDRHRQVTVAANLGDGVVLSQVTPAVQQAVNQLALPPGYTVSQGGSAQQQAQSFGQLGMALLISILLAYLLMAILYNSLIHPLVILFGLPLAFSGAVVATFLFHYTLNVFSMIGMILLVGLAIKNGILVVDRTNQNRARGMERRAALLEAGPARLRAILMTSLTIAASLTPTAFQLGEGADLRAPLAATVLGGVISSTALTLVVVPVVYTLLDGLTAQTARLGHIRLGRVHRRPSGSDVGAISDRFAGSLPRSSLALGHISRNGRHQDQEAAPPSVRADD